MPTLLFTQNHLLALFFNFHVDLNTFEISGSHPFISLYIRAAGYQKGKNLPWTGYRQYRLGYTQVSLLSSTLASKTYEKAGQYQDSRDYIATAAAAKLLQSCPSLCDPIDGSPPGSPVPGILQARTLEWGAISFSNAWKWKVKVKSLSRVRLLAIPWTAAYLAPLSMDFQARKSTGVGVPLPSPRDYLKSPKI